MSSPERRKELALERQARYEQEELERNERENRSTWQKIFDLDVEDDLKQILWDLTDGKD